MKFKKTTFRLHLQKSKIANLTNAQHVFGGLKQEDDRTTDVDSMPKTVPNEFVDMCHSAIHTQC